MAQEVERKFLLSGIPSFLKSISAQNIRQGYVAIEKGGSEVRVRAKGTSFWLTAKSLGDLNRTEVEFLITKEIFEELWAMTENRRIEKDRYLLVEDGKTIEIDVFQGNLKGLVLAEIEFETLEIANKFKPFPWLEKDVTFDKNFKNRNLAKAVNYQSVLDLL